MDLDSFTCDLCILQRTEACWNSWEFHMNQREQSLKYSGKSRVSLQSLLLWKLSS
jgi:hypothetical protein